MTSSIPDGLSFSDLQELMKDALKEESTDTVKRMTHEEIGALVVPAVMSVREEVGDISAYKHFAMFCLYKLFEFHNEVAMETMEEANTEDERLTALCWGRDAGWLQTCLNTLRNVGCGPNDTFVDMDKDDVDDSN